MRLRTRRHICEWRLMLGEAVARGAGKRAEAGAKMTTGVARVAIRSGRLPEDHDLGERQIVRMRNRQQRRPSANRREAPRGTAMKLQLRRAAAPHHFEVAPQDAV